MQVKLKFSETRAAHLAAPRFAERDARESRKVGKVLIGYDSQFRAANKRLQ
jgi:hypothetical protein